ncbi:putative DNA modification/repair radical SAM protein [Fibrobacterales bacterium]|nr:putative DNA modification/repair radical SAM protein [Fibrobacterales bacterium]
MVSLFKTPDAEEKLRILAADSQYDLACACGTKNEKNGSRKRTADGESWIYPTTMADGRRTFLFKTLISNVCNSDCAYCPLRAEKDPRRMSLSPEETAKIFMDYLRQNRVQGIFISSGITGNADFAMERILQTARILRFKEKFHGYMHLKILPGTSDEAIYEAVSLASAVSLNIEAPGEKHFLKLSKYKDYLTQIINPLKKIAKITEHNSRGRFVCSSTQFVVGAAGEQDRDIINYSEGLYKRLGFGRVYFSAYQNTDSGANLTREHRLYQSDFLIRKYGFSASEIPLTDSGNLNLDYDPKEYWAILHPDFFPLNINRAGKNELLRIPGFGPMLVNRILKIRQNSTIRTLDFVGQKAYLAKKAGAFVRFS